MTYEETKQRKLKRLLGLRIMNWMGMIAWKNKNGEAAQFLRLTHPFTYIWIIASILFGILMQGIPETISDIRYSLKNDTVWF